MNALDATLQRSFPSVMVPRNEAVIPLVGQGERLLVAANGVYLEIVRPWIHLIRRVAQYEFETAIPYGNVSEKTELHCGPVPAELIGQFLGVTRKALPNESGAWVVWNANSRLFRLLELPVISSSTRHLGYDRPPLEEGDCLVVDCHSHGKGPAFFSPKDDADDQHDVKFALVLGNCHRKPSTALRLCAKGLFERFASVPEPWSCELTGEVLS
jgi:PRTRC genetic system protein A